MGPKEELGQSQSLADLHQGLQLTESQLLQVFNKHGLVQENPLGEKFDPNKHDALFQIPDPDKEPNTVMDVQKVGYILQGRTIRPAAVGVSRKPLSVDATADERAFCFKLGSGRL